MATQEYRVTEVNDVADKLIQDSHPERDTIAKKKRVRSFFKLLFY